MPAIERVRGLSPERLWNDYVIARRPVVITDLLDGVSTRTTAELVARFADLVAIAETAERPARTLGDVFARRDTGVHALDLPIEHVQATRLHELVARLKTPIDRRLEEVGRGPMPAGHALVFYGNGDRTPCHTDGWIAQSVTAQLAGNKEWFLVPPQNVAALGPRGSDVLFDPMKLSREQRRALADVVGGYAIDLAPGETLFWPHHWLHGTYYAEPSIACVLHFGRDPYSMFVSREVHRCFWRHAILEHMYPAETVQRQHWTEFVALHDACKRDYADASARFDAVDATLRELYARYFPSQPAASLAFDLDAIRDLDKASAASFYAGLERTRAAWRDVTELPLFDWWQQVAR